MRIVVTAAGMVTPIGIGAEDFSCALYAGKSGAAPSERFPGITVAEVRDFAPEKWLGGKGIRVLDRSARLLATAAQLALDQGGLAADEDDHGLSLICGTMFGSVHSIVSFDWTGINDGPHLVNPSEFPNTVINSASGQTAIKHKLRGVNTTVSAGGASGLHALSYAADCVRFGRTKTALAGGVDELCEETVLAYQKNGLLSASGMARPFDGARDGVVMGEGAVLCVVESSEQAIESGRIPWFEISGFGSTYDARHTLSFDLHGTGAATAMEQALADADIQPGQIAFVVASASGSRAGDCMEACALRRVFGPEFERVPLFAPKAATGDMMGAFGPVGAIVAGLALQSGKLPVRNGLHAEGRPVSGCYALVNAFGCDGNNASMVIGQWRN